MGVEYGNAHAVTASAAEQSIFFGRIKKMDRFDPFALDQISPGQIPLTSVLKCDPIRAAGGEGLSNAGAATSCAGRQ
jgi:hypothetical protein